MYKKEKRTAKSAKDTKKKRKKERKKERKKIWRSLTNKWYKSPLRITNYEL